MFTRSMYRAADMIAQHKLLGRVAALLDEGVLKTTVGEHYGDITVENPPSCAYGAGEQQDRREDCPRASLAEAR